MQLKLIACEVFLREVCWCAARTPHTVDPEFTPKGYHDISDFLRNRIQERIEVAVSDTAREYDAILLGFGLCGNATVGLRAPQVPLIVPRAHDCCTILLGSRAKFREYFGENPSMPFSSAGYLERGDSYLRESNTQDLLGLNKTYAEYVALYGEDNARYLMETLKSSVSYSGKKRVVYIDLPQTSHLGFAEKCRQKAEEEGKELQVIPGSITLLEDLLFGRWDEDKFLIVPPGRTIAGVYDWEEIIRAD